MVPSFPCVNEFYSSLPSTRTLEELRLRTYMVFNSDACLLSNCKENFFLQAFSDFTYTVHRVMVAWQTITSSGDFVSFTENNFFLLFN